MAEVRDNTGKDIIDVCAERGRGGFCGVTKACQMGITISKMTLNLLHTSIAVFVNAGDRVEYTTLNLHPIVDFVQ